MTASDSTTITFDEMADLCLRHRCFQSPSLLHGVLCGQLCGQERLPRAQWVMLFTQLLGESAEPLSEAEQATIYTWYDETLAALTDPDMGFEPLLPGELYSLEERLTGLVRWTQGFLKSVDAAQVDREQLTPELKEGLDDLKSIVDLGHKRLDDSNDNEHDLIALSEFVRMVAMMLYLERHPGQPQVEDPGKPSSVH